MNLKKWTHVVDASTIIWLVAFLCGLFTTGKINIYCGYIALILLPVFICDLVIIFRQEADFKTFIKKRWFDILLVIPYFRIFRILRLARVLKIMRITKMKRTLGLTRFTKKCKRVVRVVSQKTGC